MFLIAEVLNRALGMIFASQDTVLLELMVYGFKIIAISVLFTGINVLLQGSSQRLITAKYRL